MDQKISSETEELETMLNHAQDVLGTISKKLKLFSKKKGEFSESSNSEIHNTCEIENPEVAKFLINSRNLRSEFLNDSFFGEPAWGILLNLYLSHVEDRPMRITSLCISSGVPPTTALRWIGQMTEAGILNRTVDKLDPRATYIFLSDDALGGMYNYLKSVGRLIQDIRFTGTAAR